MKIQHFSNTMVGIEGKHTRLISDPWITHDTVQSSNIYNFPPVPISIEEFGKRNYTHIHVTHSHPDHYCPNTLAAFDRDIPVLVANWDNNFLGKAIKAQGFRNVHYIDWETGLDLGNGDHVWIKTSDAYKDIDSMSVWKIDGKYILNTNDCGHVEEEIIGVHERFPQIDVALIAESLVGPYPQFYDHLTNEEKAEKGKAKMLRNFERLLWNMKTLKPEITIPFGGGVIYGGEKKVASVGYAGVATKQQADEYLTANAGDLDFLVLPSTGAYDTETKTEIEPEIPVYSDEQMADYIKEIASKPSLFDEGGPYYLAPHLRTDLLPVFQAARQKLRKWQTIKGVEGDMNVIYDLGQEWCYQLNLNDDEVHKIPRDEAYKMSPMMLFELPYALMAAILLRFFNFNNCVTPQMTCYRNPDVYNPDYQMIVTHLHL